MEKKETLTLKFHDASDQRELEDSFPADARWRDVLDSILTRMDLPANSQNSTTVWEGRLDREGRMLHPSEVVGQSLQPNDRIQLQPEITAG